jgi:uncharacterized protein (TIGR03435 family)
MKALLAAACVSAALAQTFDVASVKPSGRTVGRDAQSAVSYEAKRVAGRNVTLKRLIAEAYGLAMYQVSGGPKWLDENEYDIDARVDNPATKEELRARLRTLLTERFHLATHLESKEMRLYELVVGKGGLRISPAAEGSKPPRGFRGTMSQFANLLSVQLAIPAASDPGKPAMSSGAVVPVVDQTGLTGIYDFNVEVRPELGVDMFTLWQRALQELGLRLENKRSKVDILVVDGAQRIPEAN